MNDPSLAHPPNQLLRAFGLGQLEGAAAEKVAEHLEACRDCSETMAGLQDDTFVSLVRKSPGPLAGQQADVQATIDSQSGVIGESATLVELPPELGRHPRYEIVELIGRGGMGDVYKAQHKVMNRTVALKVIRPELVKNAAAVERFHREVQAAARLHHTNIVTSHDAEQAGNLHFLVMEFVDGVDLSQVIQERGPLPIAEACDCIRQAATGLEHARQLGMVHRDIKPHNLMLTGNGEIKILDFGLANFASEVVADEAGDHAAMGADATRGSLQQLTQMGTVMGTPDYIAPEQAADARTADIRSDIYSLGCTLAFLLTGKPLFDGASVTDKLKAHAEQSPPRIGDSRSDIPCELQRVVDRMLAKNPAARFQAPAEVAAALAPFIRPTGSPPRKRTLRNVLASAVAILLAGVIIYLATDTGSIQIDANGINSPGAKVVLLKNGEEYASFDIAATREVQKIRAGEYEVQLRNAAGNLQMDVWSRRGNTNNWGEPDDHERKPVVLYRGGGLLVRVLRNETTPAAAPTDYDRFQGRWGAISAKAGNGSIPTPAIPQWTMRFTGRNVRVTTPTSSDEGTFTLDPAKNPKEIDIEPAAGGQRRLRGIYRFVGDELEVCMDDSNRKRPIQWDVDVGTRQLLIRLQKSPRLSNQPVRLEPLRQFSGHTRFITRVDWNPTSRIAYSISNDKTLREWDVATGTQTNIMELNHPLSGLAVSAAGWLAALAFENPPNATIELWDMVAVKRVGVLQGHTDRVVTMALTRDAKRLMSAGFDNTLRIWDVEKQSVLREFRISNPDSASLSSDGRLVAARDADDVCKVNVWSTETGELVQTFDTSKAGRLLRTAFFADGQRLVTGSLSGAIQIWRLSDDAELLRIQAHDGPCYHVGVTPDNQQLVTSGADLRLRVWSLLDGTKLADAQAATQRFKRLAISPDGQHVITGGGWEWNEAQEQMETDGDNDVYLYSLVDIVPSADLLRDETRLQGKWVPISVKSRGKELTAEQLARMEIELNGDRATFTDPDSGLQQTGRFSIDASRSPKHIDFIAPDGSERLPGVFEFDGEWLKLAWCDGDYARPTNFAPAETPDHMTAVFQRMPGSAPAIASENDESASPPMLDETQQEVVKAAEEYLAEMDAGRLGSLRDMVSSLARQHVTREQVSQTYQKLRDTFGKATQRTLQRVQVYDQFPNMPNGRYATVQYKTDFERQKGLWESLLLNVDTDGQWRVNTYATTLEPMPFPEVKQDPVVAKKKQVALSAAQAWLELADAGKYGESWEASATINREGVSKQQIIDGYNELFQPLGKLQSRTFKSSEYTTQMPRAPVGEYSVIQFNTQFTNGRIIETLIMMLESDGQWRVAGYRHAEDNSDLAPPPLAPRQTPPPPRAGLLTNPPKLPPGGLPVGKNLIDDPSLEETATGQLPKGWFAWLNDGPDFKCEVVEGGVTGRHCLQISGTGTRGVVFATSIPLDCTKRYALKGRVKVEGEAGTWAVVKLNYFNSTGWLGVDDRVGVTTRDLDWKLFEKTDIADQYPAATLIVPTCHIEGDGTAWFDDLEVIAYDREKLPENFDTTHGKNNRMK